MVYNTYGGGEQAAASQQAKLYVRRLLSYRFIYTVFIAVLSATIAVSLDTAWNNFHLINLPSVDPRLIMMLSSLFTLLQLVLLIYISGLLLKINDELDTSKHLEKDLLEIHDIIREVREMARQTHAHVQDLHGATPYAS